MKRYLKEIVFGVHTVLFIVCLIPFYYHNEQLQDLATAFLIINWIGVVCSIVYFFNDGFVNMMLVLLSVFVFVAFPTSISDFNGKKDIDECPVYTNVVLDSVTISYTGKCGCVPNYDLHASYLVDNKKYLFFKSFPKVQSYLDNPSEWLYNKGDTIAIVYACRHPEINRILYRSAKDSSLYYEESR